MTATTNPEQGEGIKWLDIVSAPLQRKVARSARAGSVNAHGDQVA
jgi:hypothetical protein